MTLRRRRITFVSILFIVAYIMAWMYAVQEESLTDTTTKSDTNSGKVVRTGDTALDVLYTLETKGRASKTGYQRDKFGDGWQKDSACDTRNAILRRDLTDVVVSATCKVTSGTLKDPYTNETIRFTRGADTSDEVQIDHVVALSDAWQKGAQQLSYDRRVAFANDALNLLAVKGDANQEKSASDAASWLPPNKSFRCQYVARQIAVKARYNLWVTSAEKTAMERVLRACPEERVLR